MALSFGGNNSGNGSIVINIDANDNASVQLENISNAISNFGRCVNGTGSGQSLFSNYSRDLTIFGGQLIAVGRTLGRFNDGIISGIEKAGAKITDFCRNTINDYRELSKLEGEMRGVIGNDYDPVTGKRISSATATEYGNTIMSNARSSTRSGALWNEKDYVSTATELYKTGISGVATNEDTMNFLMQFKTANNLTDEEVGQTVAILQQRAKASGENIGDLGTMKRYLNQIQMSADLSPADVSDIIQGMTYGDPLARANGLDFASEMALLAGFSGGGYTGSQGGTMLRRTLQNIPISDLKLSQLSKTKKGGLEETGLLDYWGAFTEDLSQYDSSNDSNWTKRFDLLDKYMSGSKYKDMYGTDMTENQMMGFAYTLLGAQGEALPQLLKGMGFSDKQVQMFQNAGEGTSVEDKYDAKAKNLDGAMTKLENAFSSLSTEVGSNFAPFLSELANQIINMLNGDEFDKDTLKKAFEKSMEGLGQMLEGILGKETAEKIKNLGSNLFDFAIKLGEIIKAGLPDLLDNIADAVSELSEGNIASGIHKLITMFEGINLDGISDEDTKKMGEGIFKALDLFSKVGALGDSLENVGGILVGIGAFFNLCSMIGRVFGRGGSIIGNLFPNAGVGAGTTGTDVLGEGGAYALGEAGTTGAEVIGEAVEGAEIVGAGTAGAGTATGVGAGAVLGGLGTAGLFSLAAGAGAYLVSGGFAELLNSFYDEDDQMTGNMFEGFGVSKNARKQYLETYGDRQKFGDMADDVLNNPNWIPSTYNIGGNNTKFNKEQRALRNWQESSKNLKDTHGDSAYEDAIERKEAERRKRLRIKESEESGKELTNALTNTLNIPKPSQLSKELEEIRQKDKPELKVNEPGSVSKILENRRNRGDGTVIRPLTAKEQQLETAINRTKGKEDTSPFKLSDFSGVAESIRNAIGGATSGKNLQPQVVQQSNNPIQSAVTSNTNLQNQNNVQVSTAVNSPFTVTVVMHNTVTGSNTITRTISGNRESTTKTTSAVQNASRNTSTQNAQQK